MNPDQQSAATIQTYSGRMFDLFNPTRSQISLPDISHATSMICRYGGHSKKFYSVAEHCVLLAEYFEQQDDYDLARAALLHDASEAYMGDVVRPLKLRLALYQSVEVDLQKMIFANYGLPPEMPREIKQADLQICNDERAILLDPRPWHPSIDSLPMLGVRLRCWGPTEAKGAYVDTFWRLFG